jgi:hypothetical protein
MLTFSSCGSGGGPSEDEREANVYALVIRTLASDEPIGTDATPDELDRIVYVGSLDAERTISLDVQAAVVETLEDFATIRFVDEMGEAIDDSADGEPVLEDGVLLVLGAVPTGRSPSVEAERYVDLNDDQHFRIGFERSNGEWSVVNLDTIEP